MKAYPKTAANILKMSINAHASSLRTLTRQDFVLLDNMVPKRYTQTDHDMLVFHLSFPWHVIDVSKIATWHVILRNWVRVNLRPVNVIPIFHRRRHLGILAIWQAMIPDHLCVLHCCIQQLSIDRLLTNTMMIFVSFSRRNGKNNVRLVQENICHSP